MLIRLLHPSFLSWDPWLFTVPIWVYFCTPCFEKNIGQSFSEPCECVSRKGSRSWEWVQRTSLGRQQRLTSTKSIRTAVKEQLRKWRNNVRVWANTHTHTLRWIRVWDCSAVTAVSLDPETYREKKVLFPIILFTFPLVMFPRWPLFLFIGLFLFPPKLILKLVIG